MQKRVFTGIVVLLCAVATAQAQQLQSFADSAAENAVIRTVQDFIQAGMNPSGLDTNAADQFGIDGFAEYLSENVGKPFWPMPHINRVEDAYRVSNNDVLSVVHSIAQPDSVPFHGTVYVDWVWFLRKNDDDRWRISAVERNTGMLPAMLTLRYIDTSSAYPGSVKQRLADESVPMLWSNKDLLQHFEGHKEELQDIVEFVAKYDSIQYVARSGERIGQLNGKYMDWKMASHDIPEEIVSEYEKNASEEEIEQLRAKLRAADRLKTEGMQHIRSWERSLKLPIGTLDSLASVMYRNNVIFVNADMPWRDAMLLTVAGKEGDALGYLYSPHGELPYVTPDEFFWLEQCAEHWWIYRSTN